MLQIASNLLQTNESVLASSQTKGNALNRYVSSLTYSKTCSYKYALIATVIYLYMLQKLRENY